MRFRITILALASSLFLNISPVFGQAGDLAAGQQVLAGTEWRLVSLGRFGAESLPAARLKDNDQVWQGWSRWWLRWL